jgi:hypothetical protein
VCVRRPLARTCSARLTWRTSDFMARRRNCTGCRDRSARAVHAVETAGTKKPGAVSRPGTLREFQFHE